MSINRLRCSRLRVMIPVAWLIVLVLAPSPAAAVTSFRIAVGIDPDTLDPAQMTTTTVGNMVDYVVETLTALQPSGNVGPLLAESWTTSPDGTQYTFKLRAGVTFHDGVPFDAKAVKWNLDRLIDPAVRVPIRAPYPIEKTEVVDARTVRVTLRHPFVPFVSALSWTSAGLVSPGSAEKEGNTYTNYAHIVGTGPYELKEWRQGQTVTVTKNPSYWGRKPYYDTVVFHIVPEAATRESLLLAGQVDLIIQPPTADLPALMRNSAVKVQLAPSNRTIAIAINVTKPMLNDRRVRQALNYAVDKDAIINGMLSGAADEMDAPMAPSLFGYCRVGIYQHDPAKARQLLAEAGVKPGTPIQLIHPTGHYEQDKESTEAVAGFLREVGFQVSLQTMDWPSYVSTITAPVEQNTTQLHLLGWAPAYLDAAQQMLQFISSYAPPNGLATSFYRNAAVDELIERAEREGVPDKRANLYCEASRKVWEDAPWIFLWVQRFPIVYSVKIAGVGSLPNGKFSTLYAQPAP